MPGMVLSIKRIPGHSLYHLFVLTTTVSPTDCPMVYLQSPNDPNGFHLGFLNKAAMNFLRQGFLWTCLFTSSHLTHQRTILLIPKTHTYFKLIRNCWKVLHRFCRIAPALNSNFWGFHPFPILSVGTLLVSAVCGCASMCVFAHMGVPVLVCACMCLCVHVCVWVCGCACASV